MITYAVLITVIAITENLIMGGVVLVQRKQIIDEEYYHIKKMKELESKNFGLKIELSQMKSYYEGKGKERKQ